MKLPRGKQRTFGSRVLRTLIPRVVGFAAISSALLVGQAMAVTPSSAPIDSVPSVAPVWSAAIQAAHPGCVPSAQWPAGKPASAVIAHRFSDDSTDRIAFGTAWALNHDTSESNDVWVLGVCP
ncbi:MAG: hypothetical protein JWR52_170 [Marmoricola sp.]|nr:hypothetical protein [Marmoricola sp.]